MKEYLPLIIPAVLTALFNLIFYLVIKKKVDNSIEKYKISYSGVFKEKIDIYKSLLEKIHDLRLKLSQFQIFDDEETKNNLRAEFNNLIKIYIINQPFLSEHLVSLFKKMTEELQSVYEALVLGSLKSNRDIQSADFQKKEKKYWSAVNQLRTGDTLNEIELNIITEIRKDLQTLNHP